MGWEIIPLAKKLGPWCGAWDELNNRLYGGHPFRDSRFIDALLRYFGKGSERLCIHRTGTKIDGLLIAYHRRAGVWSQFVPDQAQAAPVLFENIDLIKDLFAALPGLAWSIELLCQDPHFAPAGLLEEGAASRLQQHALTMNVELADTFEGYWNSRSKKLAQNMRRYKKLTSEKYGATALQISNTPELMRDAVTRYGELESKGWKGEAGTAVKIENTQGQFYAEVMSRFAETGQANVVEYWLGDTLAASRLIISCRDLTIMIKTSYDESLSKFSPGRLLLKDYLEHAFTEKQHNLVEFYTNATPDQLIWATGQRHIYHVMFFRTAAFATAYDTFRRLKRCISSVAVSGQTTQKDSAVSVLFFDEIAALPPECKGLFDAGERDSFDLSADWFGLLASKAMHAHIEPRYAVFKRGNEVQGVLPLTLQRSSVGVMYVTGLSNYYSSLYRPLLAPSIDAKELTGYLGKVAADMRADVFRFDSMDPAHPCYDLLESALRSNQFRVFRFFSFGNWYLPVQGRSFEEYFHGLSSQVQNTVRRREKRFFADGRGELKIITGNNELEDAIAAWDKVYRKSWKTVEPFPEFVPGLIRLCAARGWLRMGLACYDGEAVAAQLWIVNNDRAAIYKLAYDKKFAQFSAGTVLTARLMRHVLDVDKVHEVDYLIGDDAYKTDWMSHRRERWGLVAYNPNTLGGLFGLMVQLLGRIRRYLLINPTATQAAGLSISGWELIPLEKNLGCYVEAWNNLNAELYASHPYFDSNFVEPLLENFATGQERLLIHRNGNQIDGLIIVTPMRFGKWALFLPAQLQVAPLLVRSPDVLQTLVSALPGLSLLLDIPCQDPLYSPSFDALQRLLQGPIPHAHTMNVKLEGEFENYWARRPASLRSNVGRRFRKVQSASLTIHLKRLTDHGEMSAAIDRFGQMESKGWKGTHGTAVHAENVQGRFYTEVMKRFAGRGESSIYELYFNNTLVAMELCIASKDMLVLLKTTYDESLSVYSPGRLLLYLLLEAEFLAKRVKVIEFYTNADSDGLAWATDDRWINHYMLFRNRLGRTAYQTVKSLKQRLSRGTKAA